MISKTRLLYYTLFCPGKHIPRVNIETLWYHKFMLVLTRRYKSFDEVPPKISYFDWILVKEQGVRLRYKLLKCALFLATVYAIDTFYQRNLKRVNKKLEEMVNSNEPFIPKYNILGENPAYTADLDGNLKRPSKLGYPRE